MASRRVKRSGMESGMKKQSYTYGMKLVGLLLHLFFTVVLTVAVFLLATLMSKSILELTDIGTENFFSSGYYVRCMEQKCSDLSKYFRLQQKGERRTSEEDRRYLQYTNEFKREDTNFCYWYKQNGVWYTNQPDTEEGQEFDTQTVLMEAKTMGDYLLYDMEKKEFETDIRGLEDYFFNSYGNQMYLPLENVVLVIGVDTDLTAKDDLYDANVEYVRLHPWIKVSIAAALVSVMGWVLSLVYLTLVTGHRDGEEGVHLNYIDKVKTEIVIAVFVLVTSELLMLVSHVNNSTGNVSGLLVASGTVSMVIDMLFLVFYLSMVRRLKAEVMWENSLACWLARGLSKTFRERTVTVRVLAVFSIHMMICFILAVGAFHFHSVICLLLLLPNLTSLGSACWQAGMSMCWTTEQTAVSPCWSTAGRMQTAAAHLLPLCCTLRPTALILSARIRTAVFCWRQLPRGNKFCGG